VTHDAYRACAEPGPIALRTEGLSKRWGMIYANDRVDLSLPVGARYALIGPNGAGKTTLVNLVFRFAQRVAVLVDGRLLTEGTPGEIAADARVRDVYLGETSGSGTP
jgi:branched-chain amino acid transport system ATP-binding protein